MIFGGCLCALGALRRKISKQIKQFHGAKLSAVPNCPRAPVLNSMLHTVVFPPSDRAECSSGLENLLLTCCWQGQHRRKCQRWEK